MAETINCECYLQEVQDARMQREGEGEGRERREEREKRREREREISEIVRMNK